MEFIILSQRYARKTGRGGKLAIERKNQDFFHTDPRRQRYIADHSVSVLGRVVSFVPFLRHSESWRWFSC